MHLALTLSLVRVRGRFFLPNIIFQSPQETERADGVPFDLVSSLRRQCLHQFIPHKVCGILSLHLSSAQFLFYYFPVKMLFFFLFGYELALGFSSWFFLQLLNQLYLLCFCFCYFKFQTTQMFSNVKTTFFRWVSLTWLWWLLTFLHLLFFFYFLDWSNKSI